MPGEGVGDVGEAEKGVRISISCIVAVVVGTLHPHSLRRQDSVSQFEDEQRRVESRCMSTDTWRLLAGTGLSERVISSGG